VDKEKILELFWKFLDLKGFKWFMRHDIDYVIHEFNKWLKQHGYNIELSIDKFIELISEKKENIEKPRTIKLMNWKEFIEYLKSH